MPKSNVWKILDKLKNEILVNQTLRIDFFTALVLIFSFYCDLVVDIIYHVYFRKIYIDATWKLEANISMYGSGYLLGVVTT